MYFNPSYEPTLDCQTCGKVIHRLSQSERKEVAYNPYAFIAFCSDQCRKDGTDRDFVSYSMI